MLMLINTVILVLRDMLPLFILAMWFVAYLSPRLLTVKSILPITAVGIVATLVFFSFAARISNYFDGAGLELFLVILISLVYVSLLLGSAGKLNNLNNNQLSDKLLLIGFCCLFVIKGMNFLIYFNGYLSRSSNDLGIVIGILVAFGIAASFSILCFFILRWLAESSRRSILNVLWALFLAGSVTQTVPLLAQIDVISGAESLWNSSWLIKDSSEFGHILKALMGYEATPSVRFILVYLGSISLFYLVLFIMSTARFSTMVKGSVNES